MWERRPREPACWEARGQVWAGEREEQSPGGRCLRPAGLCCLFASLYLCMKPSTQGPCARYAQAGIRQLQGCSSVHILTPSLIPTCCASPISLSVLKPKDSARSFYFAVLQAASHPHPRPLPPPPPPPGKAQGCAPL